MDTLEDVLLYLARHVPAGHTELARMEQIIRDAFAAEPAPAGQEQQG